MYNILEIDCFEVASHYKAIWFSHLPFVTCNSVLIREGKREQSEFCPNPLSAIPNYLTFCKPFKPYEFIIITYRIRIAKPTVKN